MGTATEHQRLTLQCNLYLPGTLHQVWIIFPTLLFTSRRSAAVQRFLQHVFHGLRHELYWTENRGLSRERMLSWFTYMSLCSCPIHLLQVSEARVPEKRRCHCFSFGRRAALVISSTSPVPWRTRRVDKNCPISPTSSAGMESMSDAASTVRLACNEVIPCPAGDWRKRTK